MGNADTEIMSRKPRVGRPALPKGQQQTLVPVRFPPDLIERLDAEIEARGDGMSRSALIRLYVAEGLAGAEKRRG